MDRSIFYGFVCLVLVVAGIAGHAAPARTLPAATFKGWVTLEDTAGEQAIEQVWRRPLKNVPKHCDGYLMVTYQAEQTPSEVAATTRQQAFLQRDRFNQYRSQGYTVLPETWKLQGLDGMRVLVQGLSHSVEATRAHRAELFLFAVTREDWVIYLEVRQSGTADDLEHAERLLKDAGGKALIETLLPSVLALWAPATPQPNPDPQPQPNPDPQPQPNPDPQPQPNPDPQPQPNPDPQPQPNPDPQPQPNPDPQPQPQPDPTPQPQPDPPTVEEPERWYNPDRTISFLLPDGWAAMGAGPFTLQGPGGVVVRVMKPETYPDDLSRDRALRQFARAQLDISLRDFEEHPWTPDAAVGVMVRYTNYAKHTTVCASVAKQGRLWRVMVDLPGERTPVPATVTALLSSLRLP